SKSGNTIIVTQAVNSYLNITVSNQVLFATAINEISAKGVSYGNSTAKKDEKIMVEFLSPNTNKPLHLGHIRNGALGMSISKLLETTGARVIKANLINDRGIHIAKSMLAWKIWGNNNTPKSTGAKGDHFVGDWYVKFSQELDRNPELINQAQEMLKQWEDGNPDIIALWKKMNSWVYEGFNDTFKKLGLEFDQTYYESETYKLGKSVVAEGLKRNVFQKEKNNAITAILPADQFGVEKDGVNKKVTLIRPDGTSVYITQDLGTTKMKFEENNLTRAIFVVGSEQEYHFKVLFSLLSKLGFAWADKCYHLSYGMVYLPDGKMKSREGKTVDADDLFDSMKNLAIEEIEKRHKDNELSQTETEQRASAVALGAINYYLLQASSRQDIHFDPKTSISFDGNTGPYCQYTYARAYSILEKNKEMRETPDFSLLGNNEELLLIQKLINFPEQINIAANELNPVKLASAIYETAKAFNQFYQKHSILNEEVKPLAAARLELVRCTSSVIKKGLSLLNIETLNRM
ncbi:MAG TPA: arginine--tRNA ligase, partial [bacterium]|nr:arginine--tRNA ligase [bacterium]